MYIVDRYDKWVNIYLFSCEVWGEYCVEIKYFFFEIEENNCLIIVFIVMWFFKLKFFG